MWAAIEDVTHQNIVNKSADEPSIIRMQLLIVSKLPTTIRSRIRPDYASPCAEDEWLSCRARTISLQEFLETFLPNLEGDGTLISLFRLPDGESVPMTAEIFRGQVVDGLINYT